MCVKTYVLVQERKRGTCYVVPHILLLRGDLSQFSAMNEVPLPEFPT